MPISRSDFLNAQSIGIPVQGPKRPKLGRIKAGEGGLIGNAGEHFVVAELLKRGAVAALAPRNAPSFDVLAAKENMMVRIRVKTKSSQYDEWQWNRLRDGTIFRHVSQTGDFVVCVDLTVETRDMRYFVVPTTTVDRWLRESFESWIKTPGREGRKHDATSKKRNLSYKKYAPALAPYADGWSLIWAQNK